MEKLSIPPKTIPYIEALRELIRTGAMASSALETSCLIDLPVVLLRSGPDAPPAKRAYIFIKLLQYVIKHRLEGKDTKTASILFGFEGYAGVPVGDRYRAVAKLYNPYWTWENYRKEPLTRHLLAVYLALEREAALTPTLPPTGTSPKQAHSGLMGQDWILERFEALYTLPGKEGEQLETFQTRRLRAVCNKIDVWRHYATVRERGASGVPHISLLGPGTASVIDTHVDTASGIRIYITEVRLPQPIYYGETIDITLHKRVDVQLQQLIPPTGKDWYGLEILKSPAEYAHIALRFPPHKQPAAVWRHENIMSGLVRPSTPTKENRLTVDPSGYVGTAWSDLSAGYSYGIALEW